MTCKGKVTNGVVVLEDGARLPEGADVTVRTIGPSTASPEADPLLQMSELAVETGIPDLATNIDHYLYGHPKVTDAQ